MINVPFVENPRFNYCAEASGSGVLQFFGVRTIPSLDGIKKISSASESLWTTTAGLTLALYSLGLQVEMVTLSRDSDEAIVSDLPTLDKSEIITNYEKIKKLGLVTHLAMTNHNKARLIEEGKPVLTLIDYAEFMRKAGDDSEHPLYSHFVTLLGIDADNAYINQPGQRDPREQQPINLTTFNMASNAAGTHRSNVVVHGLR